MLKHLGTFAILAVCLFAMLISGCPDGVQEMVPPAVEDQGTVPPGTVPTVLIYTGDTWFITPEAATAEAATTRNLLRSAGVQAEITEDGDYVRQWMLQTAATGDVNVFMLYGVIPNAIYPAGNTQADGSVAESWIETSDGNTILNQADYLGWHSDGDSHIESLSGFTQALGPTNRRAALQNLMDIPDIEIYLGRTPMTVTRDGSRLTPSLIDFSSSRPFPLDQFQGEWFAEQVLASNTGDTNATLADPVIVRDGNRGRIAIAHQTFFRDDPKGEVAAELIINYLLSDTGTGPPPPVTPPPARTPEGMVLIPAGTFQMGSEDEDANFDERPVHTVHLDAFYMDKYEVTNAQFKAFVDANPDWQKDRIDDRFHDWDYLHLWNGNNYPVGKADHPVVYVSWYAAMAYAQWAGKRLPTEAEWEYAARGRLAGKKYPWGDTITAADANYDENAGDSTPVGNYPPNGDGLYDMAGNVWEWCLDAWDADFYAVSDNSRNPLAGEETVQWLRENFATIPTDPSRVLRGGGWLNSARFLRVADRDDFSPTLTSADSGFRCARAVTP